MADGDRLLPELYDYIIDFLHDDHLSLRVCALVCRSWVPASRCHLFNHLKLTGSPPSPTRTWAENTQCRRIFATIRSSPHIASYIHKLSVVETNVVRPSTYRWVNGEITFPSLLQKLTGLRELEFHFPHPGSAGTKVSWSTMVFRDISDAMSTMFLNSLVLRQFSFNSVGDFIKIIDSCRRVKTLQLDHVDIATVTHISPTTLDQFFNAHSSAQILEEKKAEIENLILRSNSSYLIIQALLHSRSPLDLSCLRSLVISITPGSYSNVLDFLKSTPGLEKLEIEIDQEFDYDAYLDPKDTIDLSLLPSLRSLSFQSSVLLGRTEPLPWLYTTLSTIPSDSSKPNVLEELFLTCIVDKPPPSLTNQAFDNILGGWRNLDDLLIQPTFAAMRRFRLDFAIDNPIGDETVEMISQEFIKQLQNLRGKGVLEVDYCEVR
ncbi:hypothetical protein CPB84DRAFT_1770415 [Gymnopilus junonius]|uniref:F-box domain-containing protein n=1 Tax=Gymnopilus junonius TaxID=109634 RepID=A0A9P5TQZ5_GYMJU|nr:hypothetical protein CPB84DRAFT_1770415 [Gymnopilus junonius]